MHQTSLPPGDSVPVQPTSSCRIGIFVPADLERQPSGVVLARYVAHVVFLLNGQMRPGGSDVHLVMTPFSGPFPKELRLFCADRTTNVRPSDLRVLQPLVPTGDLAWDQVQARLKQEASARVASARLGSQHPRDPHADTRRWLSRDSTSGRFSSVPKMSRSTPPPIPGNQPPPIPPAG